jgi:hypothetical protein
MINYGFDNNALTLIRDYFDLRQQQIKIGAEKSDRTPIKLGVPQGSIGGCIGSIIFLAIHQRSST